MLYTHKCKRLFPANFHCIFIFYCYTYSLANFHLRHCILYIILFVCIVITFHLAYKENYGMYIFPKRVY